MADALNAFVPGVEVRVAGRAGGPLADLTFAAKDLFDVAGHPTGGGNPDWARQHPLPTRHAWAVQTLLDAGATLIGKTITDEVSLGILGENPFYGTPLNTRAPGRVAGGSSSGSAAAVAAGACDTALGTDTGGSVRVPASFCGLHGIRPTHGRLPVTGMLPQAPRSDTTGWFARDAATFARVSGVMLGEAIAPARPRVLIVAVDAFGLADPEVAAALQPMVNTLSAPRRRGARGPARPTGDLRVGAGPADAAAVGGVAHLSRVGRPRQSADGLRRGPRADRGLDDPGERAGLGRADAPRGARPDGASADRPAPSSVCPRRRSPHRTRASPSRRSSRCATASCACAPTAASPASRR